MEKRNISLFNLNYGQEEIDAVTEVLKSKWISMGPKTEEFEKKFGAFIGGQYAVSLNNCTAALHLAMRIAGVGPGDEVIVPALTFVATVNSILYVGGIPVFADIKSENDWTISPEDIRAKITPRTKAIIVMHYAGFGCDMDAIMKLAREHGLKVVEDACHAPGGVHQGKRLGTSGDMSCYSFYSNKNMSTAEGGMLLTNNEEYFQRAKLLRSHGMTTSSHERYKGGEFYDVVDYGYNYRLDDIRSAIGIVQLAKMPRDIESRNAAALHYRKLLAAVPEVQVPFDGYEGLSTYYVYPIALKKPGIRPEVMRLLAEEGVQTSMHYPPAHNFKHVERFRIPLPLTEEIGGRAITLPMYYEMPNADIDYVVDRLKAVLAKAC